MYHQWFNSVEYGKKEKNLVKAIKAMSSKSIPYWEQPMYDENMNKLLKAFEEYVQFYKAGHEKETRDSINNSLTQDK